MPESRPYVGRFAPSPSGDLHFGSLIAALGSYLQARSCHGRWLVRIEDIDPPREVPGAASRILRQLEQYGLLWDGDVVYQSRRHDRYRAVLADLQHQDKCYYCTCTRQRIQQIGGHYDGYCRARSLPPNNAALRLRQTSPVMHFHDRLRGQIDADPMLAKEDFIIHRRDGLFAYNLAVVVDDHDQGVTEIVRGADLIEPTVRQLSLYQQLDYPAPDYVHLPLALNTDGNKLSKQNHAPALPDGDPRIVLAQALAFLRQPLPTHWRDLDRDALLAWAISHWSLTTVPVESALISPEITSAFSKG
ncbi:tRNA glutamyl-Q(34) synthetase GluQRS [Dickeya poaceiphila]|uniref:Glutamyl-Q tRNA(Asp) synthetase n=1 Tax=Dickeya poaceiphila TaxID=568768 RepID=A0A5B8I339_9GAMM|nr:tRNA glutamyl-Q(34) synthetase GluQRS [Dickeya poaceiphila]QDX29144.1 tRNA glutamyl-Q(34) synthetase GluQRS [Dickeya poaceiphila]